MSEAVAQALAEARDPIEKLTAGARAFVQFLFEHTDWMRIHVRSRLSWAVRPEDPATAALWDEGQAAQSAMIREGIEAGLFWPDDPQEMALMVQALTKVQVSHAVESGETDAKAVADRLVERLLRLVCKTEIEMQEVG